MQLPTLPHVSVVDLGILQIMNAKVLTWVKVILLLTEILQALRMIAIKLLNTQM